MSTGNIELDWPQATSSETSPKDESTLELDIKLIQIADDLHMYEKRELVGTLFQISTFNVGLPFALITYLPEILNALQVTLTPEFYNLYYHYRPTIAVVLTFAGIFHSVYTGLQIGKKYRYLRNALDSTSES